MNLPPIDLDFLKRLEPLGFSYSEIKRENSLIVMRIEWLGPDDVLYAEELFERDPIRFEKLLHVNREQIVKSISFVKSKVLEAAVPT